MFEQKNRTIKFSIEMMNNSITTSDTSVVITIVVFLIVTIIGLIYTIFPINLIINSLKKVKNKITGFFAFETKFSIFN